MTKSRKIEDFSLSRNDKEHKGEKRQSKINQKLTPQYGTPRSINALTEMQRKPKYVA